MGTIGLTAETRGVGLVREEKPMFKKGPKERR